MRLHDSAIKAVAAIPQLTCLVFAQRFAAWPQPVTTQPHAAALVDRVLWCEQGK